MFVARVTADVDALQQFMEWGGIAWIISITQAVGALALMLVYSWQLALAIVLLMIAAAADRRASMQARLTAAFNAARTRVGEMLSEVSESRDGRGRGARVRAGRAHATDKVEARDRRAVPGRGRRALPRGDAVADVDRLLRASRSRSSSCWARSTGPSGGSRSGEVTAFLFLADVFLHVFTDLPEIYAETQTAIAGWRKILAVLDLPIEIVEPTAGVELPRGTALGPKRRTCASRTARARRCCTASRSTVPARRARRDRRRDRRAGRPRSRSSCPRLADPASGRILVDGVDLRDVSTDIATRTRSAWCRRTGSCSTRRCARTCGTADRPRATGRSRRRSTSSGSPTGSRRCRTGLETPVGERGEALSRRRAAARGARAGADRRPGAADPRRGDERRGPGHRAADHRGAAAALGRTDRGHDRAPAVDGRARGPRAGLRRRPSSSSRGRTRSCWSRGGRVRGALHGAGSATCETTVPRPRARPREPNLELSEPGRTCLGTDIIFELFELTGEIGSERPGRHGATNSTLRSTPTASRYPRPHVGPASRDGAPITLPRGRHAPAQRSGASRHDPSRPRSACRGSTPRPSTTCGSRKAS